MEKNEADKLYDLKQFVKLKYLETLHKLKKLGNQQARERFFQEKCSEIRLEIDKLTINELSQRLGENQNTSQSLQLGQVKMILSSFLQSAGKQMKGSEKKLADVVDIINQKDQSANSLIIKLWNTILHSVSEFKTNVSNQSEGISQQLGIVDGKLDFIMDSIEAVKKEVLLEISKVQDMPLNKSHEKIGINEMLNQAKKIQFDMFRLSQTNIQLPVFDIQKMSSHLISTQLDHAHLNLSHAFVNSLVKKPRLSEPQLLQAKRQWKLTANPKLCQQFNDNGFANRVIIQCQNGNIVVGGYDKKLYQYSSDFKQLQVKVIDRELYNGLANRKLLYCAIGIQLQILDQNTLNTIKTINTQLNIYKMLLVDDWLILGQLNGFLDIISISQHKNIFKTKLQYEDINDIVKLSNNEYVFASNKGLYIMNITHNNDQILYKENTDEHYFEDQQVLCVQSAQQHLLIVGIHENNKLQLVDRKCKQVIKQIGQFNGDYNIITRILGFDEQSFPYFIVTDTQYITIINSNTYDIISTTNCQYDSWSRKSSITQKQVNDKLYLFTLSYNQTNRQRGIQQLEIADLQ